MNSTSGSAGPAAISPEQLLQQLQWRYATKKFDSTRKIGQKDWETLEEALVLSPSSFGLQPWKFIVVTNSSVREKLKAASWNQSQIVDASHLVVFAVKRDLNAADVEKLIARIVSVREVSPDSLESYKEMMLGFVANGAKGLDINAWSAKQVYIALGQFLTSAALLAIDACPMEGLDPKAYDDILGLDKNGYHTLMVAAAGYRAADDVYAHARKVRFSRQEMVDHRV